jgi:outer membrane lipoprotein SlyB
MAETTTTSSIDPALLPYLTAGLEQAKSLFLTGKQPEFFAGQTYVSPSAQTEQALAQQEALATQASPVLQQAQQAYQQALGGIGATASGGFLQGSPYQQAAMQAATRPLEQQFSQQVLPGIASLYSKSGRYGSGAMQNALTGATETYGRALGDITANMANQQYMAERGLQQQAQLSQAQLAGLAPAIYGQQYIPSQQLAQVGAAREAIAAQPLQEQMARYQFAQQLPYQQLQGYLSSVYGTPLNNYGTQTTQAPSNYIGSALGGAGLGYLAGNLLGGTTGGISNAYLGAGLGALGGGLLAGF